MVPVRAGLAGADDTFMTSTGASTAPSPTHGDGAAPATPADPADPVDPVDPVSQLDIFDDWAAHDTDNDGNTLFTAQELAVERAANDLKAIEDIYLECDRAHREGVHIAKVSAGDKEFHFQNWFQDRLDACGLAYYEPERNTYPDFRLRRHHLGIEVKGVETPGRTADFDSNSQLPSGTHATRDIYYFFGRYPAKTGKKPTYPVLDLILCHGSFLNTENGDLRKNSSFKGFGSYGDISIRVRKMFVVPSPFARTHNTQGTTTLIVPAHLQPTSDLLVPVGDLTRIETDEIITHFQEVVGGKDERIIYAEPNPNAGREHHFTAYRTHQAASHQTALGPNTVTLNAG